MSDTTQPQDSSLIGQRTLRIQKAASIRELGLDPYPARVRKTNPNQEIKDNYDSMEGQTVSITGRVMSWREHGHIRFANLRDDSGEIQLYMKDDEFPTDATNSTLGWNDLNLVDIGDFVEATGTVTKTQRGEISVMPKELRVIAKAIRPLPSKWDGLEDKEQRYRRRYLDMTMNLEVKERIKRRSKFWIAVREFLVEKGFYEVYIPVLEHVTGGADAKPFVTHHDQLDQDLYLRISQELFLKRLIGGGFERVFEIGPRFRNEGISDEHLPEHIAMEFYWAYADYRDGMNLVRDMIRYVAQEVYGTLQFNIRGFEIDLSKDWEEIDYEQIIQEKLGIDIYNDELEKMIGVLREHGVDTRDMNKNRAVDSLWKILRKDIAGPAFLVNIPKFMSPLAKSNPDKPEVTERYHPLFAGSEVGNGYSELNDPIDQYDRFMEQQDMRDAGDDEAQMLDIDFVEMLEYGMPPTSGFGLSERVFWFIEGVTAKEAVPFPQMRHELDNVTKEIYGIEDQKEPPTEGGQ